MTIRTVNGNTFTENGWPLEDQDGCTWIGIAGANVTIQVQSGVPADLLGMWEADWNAFVELLEDATTACWTPGNSVLGGYGRNNGSNHLGGTAVDDDWEKHPMGPHAPDDPRAGFTVAQVNTIREMIAYYTFTAKDGTVIQLVWWANDWDEPHDSMHSQMGYLTYKYRDEVAAWIREHRRADGFSTFRRGAMPAMPPAVQVLSAAIGNNDLAFCASILPEIQSGLIGSHCNTPLRIAMWLAQEGEESAGFTATVEIGTLDGTTYQGRTWEQITGLANYRAFSQWCFDQGLVTSSTYFVDNPERLGDVRWESLGATWYWTVARPQINGLADAGDLEGVTVAINGGLHGIDARRARYNLALAQGDSLLALLQEGEDSWMSNPDVVSMITEIHRETVVQKSPSRSFMAEDGKLIDSPLGIEWNTDGNVWTLVLTEAYRLGVTLAVNTVEYIAANGVYPDTYASEDFNEWLATFGREYCQGLVREKQAKSTTPVRVPAKRKPRS